MQRIYRRLLHWAFEKLYHEFAWSYDLVAAAVSLGQWQHWTYAALPYVRGGRVLELGCGTGYLQLALAQAALPHVGYDESAQMIRRARRRLQAGGFESRILRGLAQTLPFPAATFTDVVVTFPAPYIFDPRTLEEIRRVLERDGQLVIVDDGHVPSGTYETVVDLAYRATLQKGTDDRYTPALQQAGFALASRRVAVGRGSVGIIVAEPL